MQSQLRLICLANVSLSLCIKRGHCCSSRVQLSKCLPSVPPPPSPSRPPLCLLVYLSRHSPALALPGPKVPSSLLKVMHHWGYQYQSAYLSDVLCVLGFVVECEHASSPFLFADVKRWAQHSELCMLQGLWAPNACLPFVHFSLVNSFSVVNHNRLQVQGIPFNILGLVKQK